MTPTDRPPLDLSPAVDGASFVLDRPRRPAPDPTSYPVRVVEHRCRVRHRSWPTTARCEWPRAVSVTGDGPWATLAWCPGGSRPGPALTIALWPTEDEARSARASIDRSGCGGQCRRDHEIVSLVPIHRARKAARP